MSLENLNFGETENENKITATEPEGAELSTFNPWNEDVSGEIDASDKKIPRLNIGQKSGALGEAKGYGNLILNKEVVIAAYGQKLTDITAIKIRKQFQERRPYDPSSTTMPKLFNTAKEAVAAGFATMWPADGRSASDLRLALPVANILFLIPAPSTLDQDSIDQHFFYEFNGRRYAAAVHTTSSTGYKETAKPIFTAQDTPRVKAEGPRVQTWKMESLKVQNSMNSWFVLRVSAQGFNSPEFIDFTKSILP
jgi:hypothetical protein